MYQALYRKWRPRAFADVVGQAHITDTLRRQAAEGRLSHAYLFTGTRGTGKTTCAKILAKAVNCQHPADGDPCGRCPACQGIDNGSLLDVLELDAASNNGVDHVRALRDEAIYAPANLTYRVYIIDEVHMLSTAAFNALLKILEEPPAHLIFILATTELHKVPATILSRCQRFAFKRIQPQDIARRLAYVAGQEGMDLTQDAAELLSRLSDGALRDALSLLDQCGAAGGAVDSQRVLDVLGLTGNLRTAELMDLLLRRDVPGALLLLEELYSGGKDVGALLGELSTLARDLLIHMTAPQGGEALLSGGFDRAAMDRLSQGLNPTRLIYMTGQLQAAAAALPLSVNRRTDAELCLMRLCDETLCGDTAALAARIARLEEGGLPAPASRPAPVPAKPRPAPPPKPEPELEPEPIPEPQAAPPSADGPAPIPPPPPENELFFWEPPPIPGDEDAPPPPEDEPPPARAPSPRLPKPRQAPSPAPAPAPASPPAGADSRLWDELIEPIKNHVSPMYQFMLDDARGVLEGDALVIYCGDELTKESLDGSEAAAEIQRLTGEHLGRPVQVKFVVGAAGSSPADGPPPDKLDELIRRGGKYDSFIVK